MASNSAALIVPAAPPADTNALTSLHDIKGPWKIQDWQGFLWTALIVVALGLLLYLGWRERRRRRPAPAVRVTPPHERARRRLLEALGLIAEAKPFVIAVSDALRMYLEERFSFHAPERTTEEFLVELQSTDLLLAEQKDALADFLRRCDLVKFARYEPTETELRALSDSALRLIDETEPAPIPQPAGATP